MNMLGYAAAAWAFYGTVVDVMMSMWYDMNVYRRKLPLTYGGSIIMSIEIYRVSPSLVVSTLSVPCVQHFSYI